MRVVFTFKLTVPCVSQTKADHVDNAEVAIARCSRGQYFGELALVTNKPRAASAYAEGDVKCVGEDLSTNRNTLLRRVLHYCSSFTHTRDKGLYFPSLTL